MKNIYNIILVIFLSVCSNKAIAQEAAMAKAQEYMQQKEYQKARVEYYHAYTAYAAAGKYEDAVACGTKVTGLLYINGAYKEAFEMLRDVEEKITQCETATRRSRPDLRYSTVKERMNMYMRLKKSANAKEQMVRLEALAKASGNDSINTSLLYTKANFYYLYGMNSQGDDAIRLLIEKYTAAKDYDKLLACYNDVIAIARKSGNANMTARMYDQYIMWKDSVRVLRAQDEMAALKKECNDKQAVIEEKDSAIATRQYIIGFLCVLALVLAALLIGGGIVLMRYILTTRRQKSVIDIANAQIEKKNNFIGNISAYIMPTLEKMDSSLLPVKALKAFMKHIEEMSRQEGELGVPCEVKEKNIASFCDEVAKEMEGKIDSGVTFTVNAPKLTMPMNEEMVRKILLHLLNNAARNTTSGQKITLEYKKRGAHAHQFIVTDNGKGIAKERRATLFTPFAEVKDLTKGDGLGLPICALMATRMNGTLSIDESLTKCTRFILDIHV